jgi:hypothetical protein
MKNVGSTRLFLIVKVLITLSLIAVICTKIDFSALSRHLDSRGAIYLLLGTSLLALNDVIVSARWWLFLSRLNVKTMSLRYTIAVTYSSVFVGQILPGTVGTDAVRGWFCYDRGASLQVTVMSLLTDRLVALVGVALVAGMGWFWQFETLSDRLGQQIAVLDTLVAIMAVSLAALWLLPAFVGKLAIRWGRLRCASEMLTIFRFIALSRAGAFGSELRHHCAYGQRCDLVRPRLRRRRNPVGGVSSRSRRPDFLFLADLDRRLGRAGGKPRLWPDAVQQGAGRRCDGWACSRHWTLAQLVTGRHRHVVVG